jgi:DNA invertase Pin-like site-specific DNA recombinase
MATAMKNGNGRVVADGAPTAVKTVRCAIYTRKSTDEGLQQEFNSLDAQREAGEAFIQVQRHEGWQLLPARYDDGGYTGGNMDRPALRRLLADIEAGKVDCVVVYKVDRLSRSLLDFARIIEQFDRGGVSFVSVTQQFNTTNSLGRLTLNILLSFAQFEREIISERTRDKQSALALRKTLFCDGKYRRPAIPCAERLRSRHPGHARPLCFRGRVVPIPGRGLGGAARRLRHGRVACLSAVL